MQASVDAATWEKNLKFIENIKAKIAEHKVAHHPAIGILNSGKLGKEAMKLIHLEYRHAIVQIFTDALLMAQFQTKQLEPRLAPGSKMYPRVLLSLNILDEFGFRPGFDKDNYYKGNPAYAHYPLYEDMVDEFNVTIEERTTFQPSAISDQVRTALEESYVDYKLVAALLAVAEEEVIIYSPPLRQATKALGIDVSSGYYFVHGVSSDAEAEAADDDHEEDLWLILAQACTEQDYEYITDACLKYCDLWSQFWDKQLELVKQFEVEAA
ncbi:iron-containing redox enzyme family protein [Acinetobacter sp. YH12153]|uniref:iron-containing redox enzyme family protein n=1 Tax=Acinetobacter sp. YH12153 TaxID=2601133 RepID=UPI001C553784|nr:iron-containing redox enzyme family protein [Acinetobacter sp. YH12153]